MTVREILVEMWVSMERETGEIPTRIELPSKTYDRLLADFGVHHLFEVPSARTKKLDAIVLTHASGQRVSVYRHPAKPEGE